MRTASLSIVLGLLCLGSGLKARTFTSAEGQQIEAELVRVEDEIAVLKLPNTKLARVPLAKLSQVDEAYARAWWEENKNKMSPWDLRLTIRTDVGWSKKPTTSTGKAGRTKTSESETVYSCKAENFSKKTFTNVEALLEVHKRVRSRDAKGSFTETEIIEERINLGDLATHGTREFKSTGVKCADFSNTPLKGESSVRSETILGMVLTLMVDGKEALRQSHPENFLKRIEEEEARAEERGALNADREDKMAEAANKREDSNESELSRKDREDAEREQRKRDEMEAAEQRKAEERERRGIK